MRYAMHYMHNIRSARSIGRSHLPLRSSTGCMIKCGSTRLFAYFKENFITLQRLQRFIQICEILTPRIVREREREENGKVTMKLRWAVVLKNWIYRLYRSIINSQQPTTTDGRRKELGTNPPGHFHTPANRTEFFFPADSMIPNTSFLPI